MLENQIPPVPVLIEDLGTEYPESKSRVRKYRFGIYQCYCGNEFKARTASINSKLVKSCGCFNILKIKQRTTKHGKSYHPMYLIWNDMIQRTSNKKCHAYSDYGNRGISVCERWLDIKNFIEDMYPTYKEGLSIDRVDVNGNYEPTNCRWANRTTQARNTRKLQSNNTSGYRGVQKCSKSNRFISSIGVDGKIIIIGRFINKIDAARAYDNYVIENKLEHTINGVDL